MGVGNLNRRELLKLFGMSIGGTLAGHAAWPRRISAQSRKVTPLNVARNCIVIQNAGAMSPWETLDFKETKWTAKDLEIQKVNSDFYISKTIFPSYDVWAPRASLVRSLKGVAVVHYPAQYHTQAGRALNTAIIREVPALGSVIAYELQSQRRESDTFPPFMSFDLWNVRCPQIGSGMLPPRFAGLDLNTSNVFASFGDGNESAESKSLLSERWEALGRMLEVSAVGNDRIGPKADEYKASYDYAIRLLVDPRFKKALALTEQEKKRYGVDKDSGAAKFGLAMLLARNVLAADAGARFLWVANAYNGGNGVFDNHQNIYGRGALAPTRGTALSIYDSGPRFDRAFSSLIQDLSAMPGHEPGKTLFDETLIIVAHEFGRTPDINPHGGRDHFVDAYTNMFMGGGVKPGRVIGKTNDTGAKLVDVGWKYKEQPMMDHVASTIYSALGIDYSKKIEDTPSGRAYEYQQTAPLGGPAFIPRTAIDELFT
ncbi:MAG TPA: DUF1501 domain-containing protein [Terriglobia bacterium]|nr:DUF1501 domain-containing protein [Terriglobia bacterium]